MAECNLLTGGSGELFPNIPTSKVDIYDGSILSCISLPPNASLNDVILAINDAICAINGTTYTSDITYDGAYTCPSLWNSALSVSEILEIIGTNLCAINSTTYESTTVPITSDSCADNVSWLTLSSCSGLILNQPTNVDEYLCNLSKIIQRFCVKQTAVDTPTKATYSYPAYNESRNNRNTGSSFLPQRIIVNEEIKTTSSPTAIPAQLKVQMQEFQLLAYVPESYDVTTDQAGLNIYSYARKGTITDDQVDVIANADNYVYFRLKEEQYIVQAVAIGDPEPSKLEQYDVLLTRATTNGVEVISIDTSFADTQSIGTSQIARKSINATHIQDGSITSLVLSTTGVVAGTYQAGTFTVDAAGRLTYAESVFDLSSPSNNNILAYNSSTQKYENRTIHEILPNFGGDRSLLIWNDTLSIYETGYLTLGDFVDFNVVTPALNDVLQYNGVQWVNAPISTVTGAVTKGTDETETRLLRWESNGTLYATSSQFIDDGTYTGIGDLFVGSYFNVESDEINNIARFYAKKITGDNVAVSGIATAVTAGINIAGYFESANGASNYAIQLVDGSEGAGKVLQSDAQGRGTWVTPVSGGSFNGLYKYIDGVTTLNITDNYEYFVYGDVSLDGTINVDALGFLVIENGDLNIGLGTLNLTGTLELADTENEGEYVESILTVDSVPYIITHGLNSDKIIYSIFESSVEVEADVEIINSNQISIATYGIGMNLDVKIKSIL